MTATHSAAETADAPIPARRASVPARIAEIDGLRAIALTLVVLFHLFGQGRVSGGVDVFLFVSGVVLAMSLESAIATGRGVGVFERWGRTFSRLAPPAAVVLLAVVVMSFTILPPWSREQNLVEVGSSAVYMENWQLIVSQLAYGAAGPATSPVQHFWSLSIQGQFLIVVPLVVSLVYAGRRMLTRPGSVLWALALSATIGSFVYATALQGADPEVAYFETFARIWQLGLGLLIGGALTRGITLRGWWGAVLGWTGLAAILASGWIVDGAAAYPGPAALIPVLGAAAVVLSARGALFGPRIVLGSRALTGFTKISYSLYLWHWPVLIAFLAITQRADGIVGWRGAAFVLTASLALAIATWWGLERPLGRFLALSDRRVRMIAAAVSIGAVLCVVVVSLALMHPRPEASPAAASVACEAIDAAADTNQVDCVPPLEAATCLGAAAMDPLRPECADAADLDQPPVPAYEDLRRDDDNRQECWASKPELSRAMCSLGPATGYTRHLLAVGDSHNNVFLGVYEEIAIARGWRIDVAGRPACHWTDAARLQKNETNARKCEEWNEFISAYVASTSLDAIIVTNSSRAKYEVPAGETLEEVRADGYVEAWAERKDPETPIIAIRDNPIFPLAAIPCVLDLDRVKAGECSLPRADVIFEDGLRDAVALDGNAELIDLTDYSCEPTRCSLVVGGVVVSRDGLHLTSTFARTLRPYIERALVDSVGG